MKKKLVLVWVDDSGLELTGRYRDRLRHYAETRAVPKASAVCFGDNTPKLLERLVKHIEQEKHNYRWMGYFSLDNTSKLLDIARTKALEAASQVQS
jgi:hypothetical protein